MLRFLINMHRHFFVLSRMIFVFSSMFGPTIVGAAGQTKGQFLVRDHLVIDLRSGVEWMRCSVGQQWNGTSCDGKSYAKS